MAVLHHARAQIFGVFPRFLSVSVSVCIFENTASFEISGFGWAIPQNIHLRTPQPRRRCGGGKKKEQDAPNKEASQIERLKRERKKQGKKKRQPIIIGLDEKQETFLFVICASFHLQI